MMKASLKPVLIPYLILQPGYFPKGILQFCIFMRTSCMELSASDQLLPLNALSGSSIAVLSTTGVREEEPEDTALKSVWEIAAKRTNAPLRSAMREVMMMG